MFSVAHWAADLPPLHGTGPSGCPATESTWELSLDAPPLLCTQKFPLSFHFSCLLLFSCPTLCNPTGCSIPGLSVPCHLPKFAKVHVHCISDATQASHPLMPSSSAALNPSQHQGLLQWVSCSHQITKILEFQLQHQSFQEVFRVDFP